MVGTYDGLIAFVKRFREDYGRAGVRRAMLNLHPRGQAIVTLFARGEKPHAIIRRICVENYLRGHSYEPAPADIRAAQVEFLQHVREIREAFEKAMIH
jgi:hypothetical protein